MYLFGSGTMIARRTDIANPTPSLFGVLQEVSVEFNKSIKELQGQNIYPVSIATSGVKIAGKAKYGQINFGNLANTFFGDTTATGGLTTAVAEAGSVPGSSTYTITVANSGTFSEDLGVFLTATGAQLTRVAATPATGQYSVNEATGVYTFNVAQASAAVTLYYSYTITTGNKSVITNQLQGADVVFEVYMSGTFRGGKFDLKLNQCISTKLGLAMKQGDYTIPEMDFSAFADASGNIATLSVTG